MNREEAYELLQKYIKNKNLLKHSLAAEAGMRGIYAYLHKDNFDPKVQEEWGISGLLHDIDYEVAQNENKLDQHGKLLFENGEVKLPTNIEHAIRAHNYTMTGTNPGSDMDWAITAADQLTGLIVAAALVHPDRKLEPLTTETVLKRFKEKSFAKGADRESIKLCESELNIPLDQFITIVLTSMKEIHTELGL